MKNQFLTNDEVNDFEKLVIRFTSILRTVFAELNNSGKTKHSNIVLNNYLERFLYHWEAILMIIPSFHKTFNYNYSVQLISRGILIDAITLLFLKTYLTSDGNETDFLKKIEALDLDYMKAVMDLLDDAEIPSDKKDQVLNGYYERFGTELPNFFIKENGKVRLAKPTEAGVEKVSIETMFERFKTKVNKEKGDKAKTPNHEDFKQAYFVYRYGSQFQHGSRFTKTLISDNHRLNFTNLIDTFGYSLLATINAFVTYPTKQEHIDSIDTLAKDTSEYKAKFLTIK
jgi:hypothetical protein